MRGEWPSQVVSVVLLSALGLSSGCMMPMMGMHGMQETEDSQPRAGREQAQALLATLQRVDELLSAQRILASQLPESAEKQELFERLERMEREVQELIQSWEAKTKTSHEMGRGGH